MLIHIIALLLLLALSRQPDSLFNRKIIFLLTGSSLHDALLLILIPLNALLDWNIRVEGLRVLTKQLRLADGLVSVSHFEVICAHV